MKVKFKNFYEWFGKIFYLLEIVRGVVRKIFLEEEI